MPKYSHTSISSVRDDEGRFHDVYLHLRQSLADLRELLVGSSVWLQKVKAEAEAKGDDSLDGIRSLEGVTLNFRDAPLPEDTCLIEGMPASGALAVSLNLSRLRWGDHADGFGALHRAFEEADVAVTVRLDDRSAFLHSETPPGHEPGAIFFATLTHPNGFADVIQRREKVELRIVAPGATQPFIIRTIRGADLELSLARQSDLALTFTLGPQSPRVICYSCNSYIGAVTSETRLDPTSGDLEGKLGLVFSSVFTTVWCALVPGLPVGPSA